MAARWPSFSSFLAALRAGVTDACDLLCLLIAQEIIHFSRVGHHPAGCKARGRVSCCPVAEALGGETESEVSEEHSGSWIEEGKGA